MKRRTKVIVCTVLICVIAIPCLIWLEEELTRSDLERRVRSCRDIYKPYWNVQTIREDANEKYIYIRFEEPYFSSAWEERENTIPEVYEAVVGILLEDEESQYRNYTVDISFLYICNYFRINNITADQKNMDIYTFDMYLSLDTIVETFPEARSLKLLPACYDTIEEIEGFTNLEHLYIYSLTQEELEYLQTVYPDCEIEVRYLEESEP